MISFKNIFIKFAIWEEFGNSFVIKKFVPNQLHLCLHHVNESYTI